MKRLAIMAAAMLVAATATAHEYWLEPEKTSGEPGDRVAVRLFVGEALKSDEERPFQKGRIVSLAMHSAKGKRDLIGDGIEEGRPFLKVTLGEPGGHLLACERNSATIRLEAAKFTAYLKDEGLDAIVAERARRGEAEKEGRERYSRYLKALMQSGAIRDEMFGTVVDHPLEIVPLDDPSALRSPGKLRVRVLFEEKPLSGGLVFADVRREGKIVTTSERTDREGLATLAIDSRGFALVRIVHMRRAPSGDREADWESFWAAYTFGNG